MADVATDISTFYLDPPDRFTMEATDVRVHAVAIQRWLQRRFLIREGFPCPVIFAGPMDAYAAFNRLWKDPNNPYSYLKEMVEYPGQTPGQIRFPLISIDFKKMRYRPLQSYSSRVNRRLYWPTVSSVAEGVKIGDLGNVAQARFPAAWTFVYQLEFYTSRPDTQAIFIKQLTNCFRVMSAGTPQTFIPVVYPNYFGAVAERLVLASDIDDITEKEQNNSEVQYRTSMLLELEGYAIDPNVTIAPTFWGMIVGSEAVSPLGVQSYFDFHQVKVEEDLHLRQPYLNPTLVTRTPLPPAS